MVTNVLKKLTICMVAAFATVSCGKDENDKKPAVKDTNRLAIFAATGSVASRALGILKDEKDLVLLVHGRDTKRLGDMLNGHGILGRFQNSKKELNLITQSNPNGNVATGDAEGGVEGSGLARFLDALGAGGVVYNNIVAYDDKANTNFTMTKSIVEAMQKRGIKRYIALNNIGSLEDENKEWGEKTLDYIKKSGIEYTVIRMTTIDRDGTSKLYNVREGENRVETEKNITYAAAAEFTAKVIKEVVEDRNKHKNKVYFISGK